MKKYYYNVGTGAQELCSGTFYATVIAAKLRLANLTTAASQADSAYSGIVSGYLYNWSVNGDAPAGIPIYKCYRRNGRSVFATTGAPK